LTAFWKTEAQLKKANFFSVERRQKKLRTEKNNVNRYLGAECYRYLLYGAKKVIQYTNHAAFA